MPTESDASTLPALLVSEREAARLLGGVCPKTVYSLRHAGELAGVKIGTRIFYTPAELQAFIARSAARQTHTTPAGEP
jgi:hypothetical protein